MKYALVALLVLVAFATPAKGQDCSVVSQDPLSYGTQVPPGSPGGTNPRARGDVCNDQTPPDADVYYRLNVSNVGHCNGVASPRSTFGNGFWNCNPSGITGVILPGDFNCYPKFSQEVTKATSPSDFNRFYIRVNDIAPNCTANVQTRQDFYQCQGKACACAPGPHTCPANYLWNTSTCSCVKVSPIVLDISGKGFSLTDAQHGVLFDPGIGHPVQMAWTAKGSDNAFLALPGADGVVNNGKELFGNLTQQPTSNDPNGFAALAVYDDPKNGGNGDGVIDAKDAIFSSLRLWIDANHDGISQKNEMHTLPSLGVNSLSLKYKETPKTDQYGNEFRFKGHVNPDDPHGSQVDRVAYDVFFVSVPESPTATSAKRCAVPTVVPGVEEKRGLLSKR